MVAGGVGSLINHSFSSIIIGVYEILYVGPPLVLLCWRLARLRL